MGTPETRQTTATKLARIATLSASDGLKRFVSLMHLITDESLAACFHKLDGRKAVGIDGVNKAEYGEQLEPNLKELIARMKRMGYRPGPVRQVLIPKGDKAGAMRPLGISKRIRRINALPQVSPVGWEHSKSVDFTLPGANRAEIECPST